jgi:hypothetical protein
LVSGFAKNAAGPNRRVSSAANPFAATLGARKVLVKTFAASFEPSNVFVARLFNGSVKTTVEANSLTPSPSASVMSWVTVTLSIPTKASRAASISFVDAL